MHPPTVNLPNLKTPPKKASVMNIIRSSMVIVIFPLVHYHTHGSPGIPCDHRGNFLLPEMSPVPPAPKSNDDWTPFTSREGFELAEILYLKTHLSRNIINQLLDIWSATLIPHDNLPPITNHEDLHAQIDAIGLGNVPWKSYTAHYQWLRPKNGPIPEWMTAEYQLWYRDPRQVIHNILANPEFASGTDYAPHRDFRDEKRQYCDFMSGDWAWDQCVRNMGYICHSLTVIYRISLRQTPQHTDLCLSLLYLAQTRRPFRSLLANMCIILFTSQLGMCITAFDEPIRMRLS